MVLAARACGYAGDRHLVAAAVIEFIHTATLLHDDVVDGSDKRRGRETANHVFGNEASVLVGDYLYSRAFQMMVELGNLRIQEVMANATNTIAEGEVLQLMNAHDPDTTEERYLEVIYRKTAKLFEAGAQIAAIVAGAPPEIEAGDGRTTAGTSARRSSSSTTPSTTARAQANSARTSVTTSPRASRRCRSSTRWLIRRAPRPPGCACRRKRWPRGTGPVTRAIESSGGLSTLLGSRGVRRTSPSTPWAGFPSRRTGSLRAMADFAVARSY